MARKAETTRSRLVVHTDASTTHGHYGIGISIASRNIKVAEGLLRPRDAQYINLVNYAELYAVKRALQLFGYESLLICTDSQWVEGVCNKGFYVKAYPSLAQLAAEVRDLHRRAHAKVKWIPRVKNRKADQLAKWASGYAPDLGKLKEPTWL